MAWTRIVNTNRMHARPPNDIPQSNYRFPFGKQRTQSNNRVFPENLVKIVHIQMFMFTGFSTGGLNENLYFVDMFL